MPVYAYRCGSCGVQFERHQTFSEPTLKVCPECRKKALKRVISPVRIVFKGSGFYSTDHHSSSASRAPSSSVKEDSKDGTKEGSKSARPAKETTPPAKKEKSE
jgi:putative FmdB family regulatory protein